MAWPAAERASGRRRIVSPGLCLAFVAVLRAEPSPPAIAPETTQGPEGEGPLSNDLFLPTSETAAKELAAGDEAMAKKDGDLAANRVAAFEAWRRALAGSVEGDCAQLLSGAGPARGTESVGRAVMRRLHAGGPEMETAWRSRFEGAASSALIAALENESALARVEWDFPLTRAAARSALTLADLAHESGDSIAAVTWLGRARGHADPESPEFGGAIERRAAASGADSSEDPAAAWEIASRLTLESRVELDGSESGKPGIQPGIAFLRDGRLCVQGAEKLHLVGTNGIVRSQVLLTVVHGLGWVWLAPFAEKGERWPLLPATDGARIAVVAGRAAGTQGNALLLFDEEGRPGEPDLAWGYSDAGFHSEVSGSRSIADVLGPGLWEFEPGPLIVEGAVIVQARQWGSGDGDHPAVDERQVRAWCLAFDLETGLPRWKRLLAVGAAGQARFQVARGFAHPAQPLAVRRGRILAGTGIGSGAWIDSCDGRIVAELKLRRASSGARTWSLCPPLFVRSRGPSNGMEEPPTVWAPPGSDRLYFLRPDANGRAGGPLDLEAREIGRDQALIAADRESVLLISRTGFRVTIGSSTRTFGARIDSVGLPLEDPIPSRGLVSDARVVVANGRAAYLLDRTRDLDLVDEVPLTDGEDGQDVAIAARADRVFVASERRLWILRAR